MMHLDLDAKSKILGNRYYLHHLIAQSHYSKIFLATDLAIDGRKCAIKQLYPSYFPIKMQSKIESAFLEEVEILKKIAQKHRQICQFYHYFIDAGRQYLVQEWIEGITLRQKLDRQSKLSESQTKSILSNILLALEYIHSLGIVHNDIKPSNIILRHSDRLPVLIDFGIARQVNTDYQQNIVGTPGYMSIDQAMGKVSYRNDIYSLGLTAIYLLTGRSPQSINLNSQQDNFWHQEKTTFDPKLVAIIDRAITPQSDRQLNSAKEMLSMLQSPTAISISTFRNSERSLSKIGNLILISILATLGVWFYLSCLLILQSNIKYKPSVKTTDSWETDFWETEPLISPPTARKPQPKVVKTIKHPLEKVIFVPGTTHSKVLAELGEPLWRKPGFWAGSIAWSYEDVISQGIDIGYIFDSQTNILRQAEIAVPPTTDLSTVQSAMNSFLAAEQSTTEIEQGLQAVYQRQKTTHNFTIGNLQGIIQRNNQDRIYIGVWAADFH